MRNAGPSNVFSATVTDALPTEILNPTWSCTASSQESMCNGGSDSPLTDTVEIQAGDVLTYVVTGTLDPSAYNRGGEYRAGDGAGRRHRLAARQQPDYGRRTPVAEADLWVEKAGHPPSVRVGEVLTYTLTYGNGGPSDRPAIWPSPTRWTRM